MNVRALLVGFDSSALDQPVLVESEDGAFSAADLAAVPARTQALNEHKRRVVALGGGPADPAFQRADWILRERNRAQAMAEALAAAPSGQGWQFHVGRSAGVQGSAIYPVLGVEAAPWENLPQAQWPEQSDPTIRLQSTLQEAVVTQVLDEARAHLDRQRPPSELDHDETAVEAVLHVAATSLMVSAAWRAGDGVAGRLVARLNAVAAEPYERRDSVGNLLLADETHSAVDTTIRFAQPVPIANVRAFRKALEMSDDDHQLLCDRGELWGLGRLDRDRYEGARRRCLTVIVQGRGVWELRHLDLGLMRVTDGHPRLPAEAFSEQDFLAAVDRIFGSGAEVDGQALLALAKAAAEQAHGTMLVVHRDAAGEAQRFAPPAQAVDPVQLKAATVRAVTKIDGAVLVSPDGTCHAIGVILDGTARPGQGDSARGARFNSALRYSEADANMGKCLLIIVSEDGMISLKP